MDDLLDLDIPLNETKKQNAKNNLKKAIKEHIASMDIDGDNSTIGYRELATKHSCPKSTLQRHIQIIKQMIEENAQTTLENSSNFQADSEEYVLPITYESLMEFIEASQSQNETRGRPPVISLELIEQLKEEAKLADLAKNSKTFLRFKIWIIKSLRADAVNRGKNPYIYHLKAFGETFWTTYRKMILPEQAVDNAQTQRRYEAMIDVFNHVSIAAMWAAILSDGDPANTVPPNQISNVDKTTIKLQDSSNDNKIYLAQGTKK